MSPPPLKPPRLHVFMCQHERDAADKRGCCLAKNSMPLLKYAKGQLAQRRLNKEVRFQRAGCLNACAHGPALVVYPEGVWYRVSAEADIDAIIEEHLVGGRPVERLRIPLRDVQT